MVPLSNFYFYLTSVSCHEKKKKNVFTAWLASCLCSDLSLFISASVQNCCCSCSDKGWHLKTVCSLCRKLMLPDRVGHKIVCDSAQWCFWHCSVSGGGHCAAAGMDSTLLYPGLWLLSPWWRWYEVLLGTLPLCRKAPLAYVFHILSCPQFFISFSISLFFFSPLFWPYLPLFLFLA